MINILTGRGSQYWQTKDYQVRRCKALLDRTGFTDEELEKLDIKPTDGTGRTDTNAVYGVDQVSVTKGKKTGKRLDIRKYPQYGI